jgi:hypothetical protein
MDIGSVFDWFESMSAALEATQWEQRDLLWGAPRTSGAEKHGQHHQRRSLPQHRVDALPLVAGLSVEDLQPAVCCRIVGVA